MSLPKTKFIGSQRYKLMVALVNTRHEDGTPRLITTIKEEQLVSLAGGEEFMTLYVPDIDWKDGK